MKSLMLVGLLALAAHSSGVLAKEAACEASSSEMTFVCGASNAEDLVRLAGTPWVVASHFNLDVTSGIPPTRYGFGPLEAVDVNTHEVRRLYPSAESSTDWDGAAYPDCREPPQSLSSHGLGVRQLDKDKFRLYVVNHGGRHSVEIIDVAIEGQRLRTSWRGCATVPMDELGIWPNAVAPLPDDGFVVSGYNVATWRPGHGWEKFTSFEGKRPGVAGGPVGYANGVQVSHDGKWLFVADGMRKMVVRVPLAGGEQTTAKMSVAPDNLKWGDDGRLYAAGPVFPQEWMPNYMEPFKKCFQQALCVTGTSVAAIDPTTMAVEQLVWDESGFNGKHGLTSTALPVGDRLWLTSERSGCFAIVPLRRNRSEQTRSSR